uniref:NADH dehydrogenase [ubiquinone] 1 alpha subcomplex subunit 13 n=1 Tax=Salvator merianae TaxID=96440 RepID=A0A8D0B0B1_SALMN
MVAPKDALYMRRSSSPYACANRACQPGFLFMLRDTPSPAASYFLRPYISLETTRRGCWSLGPRLLPAALPAAVPRDARAALPARNPRAERVTTLPGSASRVTSKACAVRRAAARVQDVGVGREGEAGHAAARRLRTLRLQEEPAPPRALGALRLMRQNLDEEAKIMKDVPGWKVGESLFHTTRWVQPTVDELYFLHPQSEIDNAKLGYQFYV